MRSVVAAAFAAGTLLSLAGPAGATGTIDQQWPVAGSLPPSGNVFPQRTWMAQTFTAGRTGQLDRVGLYLASANTTLPAFTLQVWKVDTSRPTTLASTQSWGPYAFTLPNRLRDWRYFDLSPSVGLIAGTKYALVVNAPSGVLQWNYVTASGLMPNYTGGELWLGPSWGQASTSTIAYDFAFQTYVTGGTTVTNTPPTLNSPAAATVHAPEGTAPTNTGTYSDPDAGDTVALTPSTGTLTRTGTNLGSWSWTGTAGDDAASGAIVVISGDDHHNPLVTVSFTVVFDPVAPTVTVVAAGTTATAKAASTKINEGDPLSFTGSAHSPAAADNSTLQYSWSVTKDGAPYATAPATGTSFGFTPNDEGVYVVTMTAVDDGNMPGFGSTSVTVGDVPPTAVILGYVPTLTAPNIVLPNQWVTFTGTFSDPGTGDPHTASWDFGDGTPAAPGWRVVHYFTRPGDYQVTMTVDQGEDGNPGTSHITVPVLSASQALNAIAAYVQQQLPGLNKGQRNSLAVKLNNAADAVARGNSKAADNELNAFLNELAADVRTGKVSASDAGYLQLDIIAVKSTIGDYNRFLDFWPLGL